MASKVSQLNVLGILSGDEDVLIAYKGANWRVKISTIVRMFDKKSINLDNVDNTADIDKPISRAVQAALDELASTSPTVGIPDVTGLSERLTTIDASLAEFMRQLELKLDADTSFNISDIGGLSLALQGKAAATHSHSVDDVSGLSVYLMQIESALGNKAEKMHSHLAEGISDLKEYLDQYTTDLVPSVASGQHEW